MLMCVNRGVFVTVSVTRWLRRSGRRAPGIWVEEFQPCTDRSSSYLMMVPVPLEWVCCHSNRLNLGGMLSASNSVEGGRRTEIGAGEKEGPRGPF